VQKLEQEQGYVIDPLKMRNDDGDIVQFTQQDPEYTEQWGKSLQTLQASILARDNARKEAMDKLSTVVPPEEAADMAFWSELEKRDRARMMGIDYDRGTWVPGAQVEGGDQPTQAVLEELGIALPSYRMPTTRQTFDPMIDAAKAKGGVAAANAAEQARLRAQAASTTNQAVSTLPKVSTPVVKPPAGGATYDPLSSIRTTTPVAAPTKPTTSTGGLPPVRSPLPTPVSANPVQTPIGSKTFGG
jgi:hypothetical protein